MTRLLVTVAHRSVPRDGEHANGDAVYHCVVEHGLVAAVIDGVGHGPAAAAAAERAHDVLDARGLAREGAAAVLRDVHAALRGTRGAAATLVLVHGRTLRVCGVGNVGLRCAGDKVPFVSSPGILGGRASRFREASVELTRPIRLLLHSDGISPRFDLTDTLHESPADTLERLFGAHRKAHDDASMLVMDVCINGD